MLSRQRPTSGIARAITAKAIQSQRGRSERPARASLVAGELRGSRTMSAAKRRTR